MEKEYARRNKKRPRDFDCSAEGGKNSLSYGTLVLPFAVVAAGLVVSVVIGIVERVYSASFLSKGQ